MPFYQPRSSISKSKTRTLLDRHASLVTGKSASNSIIAHNYVSIHSPPPTKTPNQRPLELIKGGCFSARGNSKEDGKKKNATNLDDSGAVNGFFKNDKVSHKVNLESSGKHDIAWKLKKIIEESKKGKKDLVKSVVSYSSLKTGSGKPAEYLTQTILQHTDTDEDHRQTRKTEGSKTLIQSPRQFDTLIKTKQPISTEGKKVFTPPSESQATSKKSSSRHSHENSTAKRRSAHVERDANNAPIQCTNKLKNGTNNYSASTATNSSEKQEVKISKNTLIGPEIAEEISETDTATQLKELKVRTKGILAAYQKREVKLVEANKRLKLENESLKKQLAKCVVPL